MQQQARSMRSSSGFSLIEAMVVMGVLIILVALAAPALNGMALTQQLKNAGFDLLSSINLARSEALTRNVAVTLAPQDGNWARGWTVTEEGGTVIRRQDAYVRIALNGPMSVIFNGDGRPNSTATPFAITAPEATTDKYRCVRIRASGRPYLARGACP